MTTKKVTRQQVSIEAIAAYYATENDALWPDDDDEHGPPPITEGNALVIIAHELRTIRCKIASDLRTYDSGDGPGVAAWAKRIYKLLEGRKP